MAYIGKSPQVGNYVKLDAITTSSTNTYNLTQDSVAFVPESALHMLVSLNGVIQSTLSSFSVSGSTITFLPSSGTLSSSDTIDFILVLGNTPPWYSASNWSPIGGYSLTLSLWYLTASHYAFRVAICLVLFVSSS